MAQKNRLNKFKSEVKDASVFLVSALALTLPQIAQAGSRHHHDRYENRHYNKHYKKHYKKHK